LRCCHNCQLRCKATSFSAFSLLGRSRSRVVTNEISSKAAEVCHWWPAGAPLTAPAPTALSRLSRQPSLTLSFPWEYLIFTRHRPSTSTRTYKRHWSCSQVVQLTSSSLLRQSYLELYLSESTSLWNIHLYTIYVFQ
jgi:hypothetical protein